MHICSFLWLSSAFSIHFYAQYNVELAEQTYLGSQQLQKDDHAIQNMHLYRNLGSITFESETANFEIFSAHPQSCIVQAKSTAPPHEIFQRVSAFYKQHLHGEFVKPYSEEQKGSALVISNCQRVNTRKLDANALCQILSAATAVVLNISKLVEEWVGDIQAQLIRCINGRITFVYIPYCKVQKHEQSSNTLSAILAMASGLKNDEDVTSRLLIKKIAKCSSLADVAEEINYFSSIYAARKTNPCAIQLQTMKKSNWKQMPRRKVGLLNLNQALSKTSSTLFNCQNSRHFSETRKSSSAIHIIFPNKSRKQTSSLHSSCGSMRLSTTTKNANSYTSCRGSQPIQESKSKLLKQHQIRQERETYAIAVSPRAQQKLLEKLKNKRASRNTHRAVQQPKQRDVSFVFEEPVIKTNSCAQTIPQQAQLVNKQKLNQIPETVALKSSEDKKIVQQQQPQQKQIKLKKKAIMREQVKDDQIEDVTLDKLNPKKQTPHSTNGQKTLKNPWNSKQKTVASDILENQYSIKTEQALLQKLHNLDFIGIAVVNTRAHLKNFEQIFWQLPMFFLYRQFYLKRAQLIQEIVKYNPNSSKYNGVKEQNIKIEESLLKMINVINRKQKQEDPHTMLELKPYLNLDKRINCSAPIAAFVGQYIQQMNEALNTYPELLTHSVEVVDALLVCKGIKINSEIRNKAVKEKGLQKYLNSQKCLLAQYS